jgi:hypothetical protein
VRGLPTKERFWLGSLLEGYANWQADGLENRCPKGLVGSSPTPSAKCPLTWAFAVLPFHSLPEEQLFQKPLSQVLGGPESSHRVRLRLESEPNRRLERPTWQHFGNPRRAGRTRTSQDAREELPR